MGLAAFAPPANPVVTALLVGELPMGRALDAPKLWIVAALSVFTVEIDRSELLPTVNSWELLPTVNSWELLPVASGWEVFPVVDR